MKEKFGFWRIAAMTAGVYGLLLLGIYHSAWKVMVSAWQREDYTFCYFIERI